MGSIREVSPEKYQIAAAGHPAFHHNLAWYATDDDRVLGVVLLDLVDNDFSWVVMTQNEQGPGYTAIDFDDSLPTQQAATDSLHTAMMEEENATEK